MRVTVYDAKAPENREAELGQLPSVIVDVQPEWTNIDVIGASGAMPYSSFALLTPEIAANVSAGERVTVAATEIFGVTETGLLMYRQQGVLPWADFIRALELGLYEGDPTNLVVYPFGVAGGPMVDGLWDAVQWLLQQHDSIGQLSGEITDVSVVGGGIYAGTRFVRKSRRKQISREWRKRGITGLRLRRFLDKSAHWDPQRIETLFGLTDNEARVFLANAGYVTHEDGLWRKVAPNNYGPIKTGLDATVDKSIAEFAPGRPSPPRQDELTEDDDEWEPEW